MPCAVTRVREDAPPSVAGVTPLPVFVHCYALESDPAESDLEWLEDEAYFYFEEHELQVSLVWQA